MEEQRWNKREQKHDKKKKMLMMTGDWSKNSWRQKQGSGSGSKSECMVEVKVMYNNDMEWIGIDVK